MYLIVGLGNPGKKFKNTRHNTGFLSVEKFQKENQFPKFKSDKKTNSHLCSDQINNEKVILIKPQTFMNSSGSSVKKALSFYNIPKENLIVIHDDLDLPFGKIKVSKNKNAGGHKGVKSVINQLNSKKFTRIRIGIRPDNPPQRKKKFVLKRFSSEKREKLEEILAKSSKIIKTIVENSPQVAMNKYN